VDHHEAERDEGVDQPDRRAADDLLQKNDHRTPALKPAATSAHRSWSSDRC
jgi:hypothetical protein